jgi:hypothetical protein
MKGHYQDCTDVTRISLVAIISLSGGAFKLLFLTISRVHYNDTDLDLQRERFLTEETPKGYVTNLFSRFY